MRILQKNNCYSVTMTCDLKMRKAASVLTFVFLWFLIAVELSADVLQSFLQLQLLL